MQAKFHDRTKTGQALAEVTSSFVLFLALSLMIIYFIIQVCLFFYLTNGMQNAARQACREIANNTAQNGALMWTNYPAASSLGPPQAGQINLLNNIAIPGILKPNSSSQFQTALNQITGDTSGLSYSVTVVATYHSGSGLPTFPLNPLGVDLAGSNIGFSMTGLTVMGKATYAVPH